MKQKKNGNCLTVPPSRLPMRSIGSGNMIVEFFSADIEFNVWEIIIVIIFIMIKKNDNYNNNCGVLFC